VWSSLKPWLRELSGGKCWYSETIDRGAFSDVDHYRPKSQAIDLDGTIRPGYWWLAFDWRNFRFSSELCNRPNRDALGVTRGKWDLFPVRPGTTPAALPDDDHSTEEPYLLDPTTKDDPGLLSFNEAGEAVPMDGDGWNSERANWTISALHLDAPGFSDGRKEVWQRCMRNVHRVMVSAEAGLDDPNLRSALDELLAIIATPAEFAATARTCLLKTGHVWARELVSSTDSTCACP
jgi:hypothetical protein